MPALDDLINLYFAIIFSNKDILMILSQNRHIIISFRTLKRHYGESGLFRRKQHRDLDEVTASILTAELILLTLSRRAIMRL